jgi:hypothetical protein
LLHRHDPPGYVASGFLPPTHVACLDADVHGLQALVKLAEQGTSDRLRYRTLRLYASKVDGLQQEIADLVSAVVVVLA